MPYEAWFGEKPNIGWIRTLGCDCYVAKTQRHKQKIGSDMTEWCKLVGFDGSKNYRLLNANGNLIRSADAVFRESRPHIPEPPRSQELRESASPHAGTELPPPAGAKRSAPEPRAERPKRLRVSDAAQPASAGGEDHPLRADLHWRPEQRPKHCTPVQVDAPRSGSDADTPGDASTDLSEQIDSQSDGHQSEAGSSSTLSNINLQSTDLADEETAEPRTEPRLPVRENRGRQRGAGYLRKYAFLVALIGAASHSSEPFEPRDFQQAKANEVHWPR
ncbi:hypothetical protein EJ06DRAFT_326183 [Trichodelitschia bisporula]|uniref:Uncharacterized protein n=1 Tax=Trichodelitschia bisporula TaxID=703511 RepID=A0A6G1HHD9_9PEZI|nr:hypothetical protein EJ06DRAFT_326183 [Trichodelitschia bisporula]